MVRELIVAASVLALAGCAQGTGISPSYAGLADLSDSEASTTASTADAMRHVQSNKILGAMAFQKVTGRDVDPSSLGGRD